MSGKRGFSGVCVAKDNYAEILLDSCLHYKLNIALYYVIDSSIIYLTPENVV